MLLLHSLVLESVDSEVVKVGSDDLCLGLVDGDGRGGGGGDQQGDNNELSNNTNINKWPVNVEDFKVDLEVFVKNWEVTMIISTARHRLCFGCKSVGDKEA